MPGTLGSKMDQIYEGTNQIQRMVMVDSAQHRPK
jgi:hypothetical protein